MALPAIAQISRRRPRVRGITSSNALDSTTGSRTDRRLSGLPLLLPKRPADRRSACHLYVVEIDESRTSLDRRAAFERLRERGIGVNVHYTPGNFPPGLGRFGFSR